MCRRCGVLYSLELRYGGGVMRLRDVIVCCSLVGIMDFFFPVLFFYNHFN